MPKLLSVNSYHYRRGGSDAVYFEHDRMFVQEGWRTAVMSMHHPRNEPSAWSRYFVDELEFGHDYSPWQKAMMAGKVIYSFEARRKLAALLDEFPADVAHLHCIYHHIGPSILPILKSRGVATIMTAHDLKLACPAYLMHNAGGVCERCKGGNLTHVVRNRCIHGSLAASALVMVESTVHRALGLYRNNLDRVVTPSRFHRNKLIEWGWSPHQIEYIPNFIDCNLHRPVFEPGGYFIYFGRMSAEKGLRTLVAAAIVSGVSLRLVGSGPQEAELRAMAENTPGIEFLGYLSGESLWTQVRGARAVVLPSECYENAPMCVLEAFANGKPIIGAAIGGIPELIEPGETGWQFVPGDIAMLGDRLSEVAGMSDQQLERIGRQAREFVAERFSRQAYLQAMLALYGRLRPTLPA